MGDDTPKKEKILTEISNAGLRYPIAPLPEPLRSDFRAFLVLAWRHLNLPHPTPVQLDIARYMQTGPDRKIIEGFRGVAKSWIASVYLVWRLRNNPWLKFLVVSASKERADNFTTFTLRLIQEMPVLQCLIPKADQRCSKVSFDVGPALADHAPSVTSKGITSQITGGRADEIISDDVEVPNNSLTQSLRDKLSEAIKEYDAIIKPGGRITFLGTPQTEQSIYFQLPGRGYDVRIWPARFPTAEQVRHYGAFLSPAVLTALEKNPDLEGRPTDPTRFSDEDLLARELSYGRAGFLLQFMLDPHLADADRTPLKLSDLVVMDLAATDAPEKIVWCSAEERALKDLPCVGPRGEFYYAPMKVWETWLPYTGSIMAIDPAGRGKDETAYAVVKFLNGNLFLTASGGLQGGYGKEVMEKLTAVAKAQQVNEIIIEANFGDGMFTELLKPYLLAAEYPVTCTEVKHSSQKEKRICDVLEPVISQHRLIVDKKVIREDFESVKKYPDESGHKYQLFFQMSRITRDKGALTQDDRLDALAIAVSYWIERMSQDDDTQARHRAEEALQEELDRWMEAVHVPVLGLTQATGISLGVGSVPPSGFGFSEFGGSDPASGFLGLN